MNPLSERSARRVGTFSSKTVFAFVAAGLLCWALFCQQVSATQIYGSASFQGAVTTSGNADSATTTISFTNPGWTIASGVGNYSFPGTSVSFTSFSFSGTGDRATLLGSGMPEGRFTLGGRNYSFALTALVNAMLTNGTMFVSGTGIAHITGFDDTPASFTLQGSEQDFSFILSSAGLTDPPEFVPDTGSVVSLLGIALAGLEDLRRRLRSA